MSPMHGASLVDTLPELWNMQIKGGGMMQMLSSQHFGSSPYSNEKQSTLDNELLIRFVTKLNFKLQIIFNTI